MSELVHIPTDKRVVSLKTVCGGLVAGAVLFSSLVIYWAVSLFSG